MLKHLLMSSRIRLKLSRQQLADRTGLSLSYITMLENGTRTTLRRQTRARLALHLGVTEQELRWAEGIACKATAAVPA
jgi:transcriptional regulator with XRE-family HTH domain